jgi:hypothetical protein
MQENGRKRKYCRKIKNKKIKEMKKEKIKTKKSRYG